MQLGRTFWRGAIGAVLIAAAAGAHAQDPKQLVQQAVNTELKADRDDQTRWRYLKTADGGDESVVVETQYGALSRHIKVHGQPASPQVLRADNEFIQKFIHDPALQARQRRDGAHDDKSASELLNLMPEAFLWKVQSDKPDTITLSYSPNPGFTPPDMEARVMGGMSGTMVVTKAEHRIKTFQGRLMEDVTIGFGLLARIKSGSTFDIERRQVAPGTWEITETHVHISGHALFFKTIGTQEDEVKTDFTPVPPGTTLEQAIPMLDNK